MQKNTYSTILWQNKYTTHIQIQLCGYLHKYFLNIFVGIYIIFTFFSGRNQYIYAPKPDKNSLPLGRGWLKGWG